MYKAVKHLCRLQQALQAVLLSISTNLTFLVQSSGPSQSVSSDGGSSSNGGSSTSSDSSSSSSSYDRSVSSEIPTALCICIKTNAR